MKRIIFTLGVLILAGAGGAFSGWLTTSQTVTPALDRLEKRLDQLSTAVTSTNSAVTVVPIEPSAVSGNGADILRRRSPVLALVRKIGPKEDTAAGQDRELGAAVALTSDGWLLTSSAFFAAHHPADVSVVWNGRLFPITKAIRDTATDAAFLKIAADGLPVTALVRTSDVEAGSAVWIESRPSRVQTASLADIRVRVGGDPTSSEKAVRRFLVSGVAEGSRIGSAVWDGRGQLIGIVESSSAEGSRVLPAGDVAGALASLLTTERVTHASLGVRATDLGTVAFEDRGDLPAQGVWLRPDRKANAPAVTPTGAAGDILKEGDVILRVERDILDGTADLGERLLDYRPGTSVAFTLRRDGVEKTVEIQLGTLVTGEPIK